MIGLLALNAGYLAAGTSVMWGLRAFTGPQDVFRLVGLAYLLGLTAVVLTVIQLLVLGLSLRLALAIALPLVALAGLVTRRIRVRAAAPRGDVAKAGPLRPLGILLAVLAAVYLAFLIRLAPQLGIWEPDAVTTWTFRAKALYFENGLNAEVLRSGGAFAYPIFESTMQALAFLALGGADELALHIQFAIVLVAFVVAVAGLAGLSAPLIAVWPMLGLFLISPEVASRALSPLADFPLDFMFALGALLFALWLARRETWLLASAAIALAGAVSMKREGLLLAATVVVAAVVASLGHRRAWIAPAAAGAFALLVFVPWRLWVAAHGSATDVGNLSTSTLRPDTATVVPAVRLLVSRLFSYDAWLLIVPLTIAIAVLAALGGARRISIFYSLTMTLSFTGFVAIWWIVPDLQTDAGQEQPAVRLAGALVALSAALAPLLSAPLLRRSRARPEADLATTGAKYYRPL